ncbi:TetR/AcrR family transcriptional regulator [Mycobacterium sp. CBMA293]|uniref:TetR/AcrR family transcriptional regulator n=1 Tax=unclassified Mycolicibacterium TaxID=2636767 RepID=UPI0012DEBD6A|nr:MULTISPECIES: TetR/AcrR family transcriptional regulator [unclassified Mycolicibacterium]MUL45439.1 TetR/AcrR family transcriptional regulator [Mycolicibacterium sp. CBMA 360]MUL56960.1 TetR/AcrR family transcriptional regulator [Mycolicibacterium sp. CBMA 335]MUL70000.1 TetR/AcrR family transcriptional regulator [Mycolicibacterium sp. CBMA 311]MUL92048.1 TetR/AcrR family transcriptional regulator [Mycolicibacterium sp. CBMA 230]MUM05787.1 TetR family transcriptional regulator [Mycolicibact
MAEVSTRDRLIVEAMRLFCEQGYRATSVAQIEAAAGLAAGSGALYHHFKSKESLLEAGIDRQLDRRQAMRDISVLFRGVGDLRTELTLLGRYQLAVIDEERQLLGVAASTPAAQASRLNAAYGALIHGLSADIVDLAKNWNPDLAEADAASIALVGVNALLGRRISVLLSGVESTVSDDSFLAEWTAMLACRIETESGAADRTAS